MDEDEKKKKEKRKPTPADAAVDYVAYLMETEDQQEPEDAPRTMSPHRRLYGGWRFQAA